jgi:hypothetical protein
MPVSVSRYPRSSRCGRRRTRAAPSRTRDRSRAAPCAACRARPPARRRAAGRATRHADRGGAQSHARAERGSDPSAAGECRARTRRRCRGARPTTGRRNRDRRRVGAVLPAGAGAHQHQAALPGALRGALRLLGAPPCTALTAALVDGCIVTGSVLRRFTPRHDVLWLSLRAAGLTHGEALSIRKCDAADTSATPTPARDTRPLPPLRSAHERPGGRRCSA